MGDWLPEPLPTDYIAANFGGGPTPGDPVHDVTLDESVSTALLVLLEEVTPAERVTFILHDVFGVPFREISEIVGRTPAACRQLAVSARRHVHSGHRSRASSDLGAHSAVVSAFKRACSNGDLRDLIASLASDVTVRVDGGGRVRAALRPLRGTGQGCSLPGRRVHQTEVSSTGRAEHQRQERNAGRGTGPNRRGLLV